MSSEPAPVNVGAWGYTAAEDRYDSITAVIRADLSALDPERIASLSERTHRAVDRQCTVGHTLEHGAAYTVDVVDDPAAPVSGPRTGTV